MRGGKRDGTASSALTDRTPRRPIINRRHTAIEAKKPHENKPASLSSSTKERRGSAVGQPGENCSRRALRDGVGSGEHRLPACPFRQPCRKDFRWQAANECRQAACAPQTSRVSQGKTATIFLMRRRYLPRKQKPSR